MDVTTLLTLFYPASQQIASDTVDVALELAERYRPMCLPEEKQNEAVAWYTAYLLAQSVESGVNVAGLRREREGDLEREYFAGSDKGGNAARFLANYNALNEVCARLGAMTVGSHYV